MFMVGRIVFFVTLLNTGISWAQTEELVKGKEIYENYCRTCHESGVAGAPRAHQTQDWLKRQHKTREEWGSTAMKGFRMMPPKGTCLTCSEPDLLAAIDYMTDHSTKANS